jgi:hypothetical protein
MSEINGPLVRDPYPDLSGYEVVWPVYGTVKVVLPIPPLVLWGRENSGRKALPAPIAKLPRHRWLSVQACAVQWGISVPTAQRQLLHGVDDGRLSVRIVAKRQRLFRRVEQHG